jgi:ribosomal protein L35
MPKQKTHSGAKKRFKVTGSGKLLASAPASATCSSASPAR